MLSVKPDTVVFSPIRPPICFHYQMELQHRDQSSEMVASDQTLRPELYVRRLFMAIRKV